MADNREQFMYIDAEEDAIEQSLAQIKGDFVTSSEIAFKMGVPDIVKNRKLANKIKYVMDNKRNGTRHNDGLRVFQNVDTPE